jgi:hypothetical protein
MQIRHIMKARGDEDCTTLYGKGYPENEPLTSSLPNFGEYLCEVKSN